ncbi:TonB-dependent receptor [Nitrincola sp.]|uniref:TonB-dependent receptor n=1 Tax=Nitrincola sp. TaxID=1926584 RepID=UPI003A932B4C
MKPFYPYLLFSTALISSAWLHANESITSVTLNEIVVTSGFRPAAQEAIPASITVISAQTLEQQQSQHLEGVLSLAPNITSAKGSSRARFYQIRGVGERSQFVGHVNPSVGVLLDGIDMSSIAGAAGLMDIQQVEVLRGPQGTLYGSNALAGLINMRSNDPTTQPEGRLEASIGNYNSHSLTGIYSTPLNDSAGLRLAIQQNSSDGFMRNDHLNRKDTNNIDETFLRAKLRLVASDDLLVDLTGFYADINNGYDAFSLDNNRHTLSDEPGRDRQISKALALHSVWTGAETYQLETRLSHSATDSDYGYDEDWTFDGFHLDGYSYYDQYRRSSDTSTAELRWVSMPGGEIFNDSTQWTTGVYAFRQTAELNRIRTDVSDNVQSDFSTRRLSVYGELETLLSDTLILTSGLRAELSKSNYDDSFGVNYRKTEHLWGGRLAIDYLMNQNTTLYASLSRGYKVGGINSGFEKDKLAPDLREFGTETLWNYEIGSKGSYLNDRLQTQASVFYQQRKDAQLRGNYQPENEFSFIDYIFNAKRVNNYGAEFQFNYALDSGLSVYGMTGLLRTQVKKIKEDHLDLKSRRDVAHAPHWQYQLGLAYDTGSGWFSGASLEGMDSFYFSDSHNTRSWDYTLMNAHIGYKTADWSIRLWGRNLGNKTYAERGFFFGNDPGIGYDARPYYQLGAPRTLGVTASLNF